MNGATEIGLVVLGAACAFAVSGFGLWRWMRALKDPKRAFAFALGFFKGLVVTSKVTAITIATSSLGEKRRDFGSGEERVMIPVGAIISALERGDVILEERKGLH